MRAAFLRGFLSYDFHIMFARGRTGHMIRNITERACGQQLLFWHRKRSLFESILRFLHLLIVQTRSPMYVKKWGTLLTRTVISQVSWKGPRRLIWLFSEISRRAYFSSYYSKIFHRRKNMNFLVSRAFSPFCFLLHIQKTRNERVLNRAHLSFSATNFQRMPIKPKCMWYGMRSI